MNPSGWAITISSSSLPCKNAILTSIYYKCISFIATNDKIILIEVCLTTSEKTFVKSIPSLYVKPFTASLEIKFFWFYTRYSFFNFKNLFTANNLLALRFLYQLLGFIFIKRIHLILHSFQPLRWVFTCNSFCICFWFIIFQFMHYFQGICYYFSMSQPYSALTVLFYLSFFS